MKKILIHLFVALLLTPLLGFATNANAKNENDPYESFNRGIYEFNEVLDEIVLEPVAKGYDYIMPRFAQTGVSNFFNNIRDFITVVNNLLQLDLKNTANDSGRVIMNSTIGLLGLVDVHSMSGGERRHEDFGTTLESYGWENSNYLVLPLFGPSSFRDGAGLIVDGVFIDPISYLNNVSLRNQLRLVQITDARVSLLDATDIMDEASFDGYTFQRDSYIQFRNAQINDGDITINYDEYMDIVNLDDHKSNESNLSFLEEIIFDINKVIFGSSEKTSSIQ
jgi:phospholipid-binding lipoprotein MlaA